MRECGDKSHNKNRLEEKKMFLLLSGSFVRMYFYHACLPRHVTTCFCMVWFGFVNWGRDFVAIIKKINLQRRLRCDASSTSLKFIEWLLLLSLILKGTASELFCRERCYNISKWLLLEISKTIKQCHQLVCGRSEAFLWKQRLCYLQ